MSPHRSILYLACCTVVGLARLPAEGFSDITVASGIEDIVAQTYAADSDWWLSGLHLVDLDGDGHLDLFLSGHGGGAVATLGDGAGRFAIPPGTWPDKEIHIPYDIDGDGLIDLSMTHEDGGGRWWLNRSSPGTLSFLATGMTRGTNTSRKQAIADADGDGKVDWWRSGRIDTGDGNGSFTEGGGSVPGTLPVDIDGDGDLDIVVGGGGYSDQDGSLRIWRNDGGSYSDITDWAGVGADTLAFRGCVDVDHDGDPDLVLLESRVPSGIWLNDGSGRFSRLAGAISGGQQTASYGDWGIASITDLDNDGQADLVVNGKHFLKIWRGTGGGHFTYMNAAWDIVDTAAAAVDEGNCWGDIDEDGDIDIVGFRAVWPRKYINVYRNDLPARNWLRVRALGVPGNRGAANAKIRIHDPGDGTLLWYQEILIYCSQAAFPCYAFATSERHFGLGSRSTVDVSVTFHPSGTVVWQRDVAANQVIEISEDGAGGGDNQVPSILTLTVTPQPVTGTSASASATAEDADGDPLSYSWSVSGPSPVGIATPAAASTALSFTGSGSYTVTLAITDGRGGADSTSRSIEVVQTASGLEISP